MSILSSIRNEIQENWDTIYMNAKYNPGSWFQEKVVNKKKTRKTQHEHFPKSPHVQQLIKIFENLHNDMTVIDLCFLRRRMQVMDLRNYTMTTKTVEVEVIMSLSQ